MSAGVSAAMLGGVTLTVMLALKLVGGGPATGAKNSSRLIATQHVPQLVVETFVALAGDGIQCSARRPVHDITPSPVDPAARVPAWLSDGREKPQAVQPGAA